MYEGLIIAGAVLLAAGIILGHFFPNRYWIILIAIGILLLVLGVLFMLVPQAAPPYLVLPPALSN